MDYLHFDNGVWERLLSLLEYDAAQPISLVSALFLFAFLVFGIGYLAVRNHRTLRTLYVVLFSLYFYYKLSGAYLLLLLFVALSDYTIARLVARSQRRGRRGRGWVALSVVINVAILVVFKASSLVADLLATLFEGGIFNIEALVVPAGVSFFVFQSIAYVVDVSRGTIAPLRRFSDYLFLLSFFPKMFLGPLVRAKEFIPQIESPRPTLLREELGRAVTLIAGGLLKYAVISKSLGVLFVTPAFAGELGDSGAVALVAIYGFTLQIYCDFSGYSDIAVGVALLLGFRLPDNFDAPYKSATITEFWRRWHISLSSWLRDYLYIPLGGNRRGRVRTYLNLFITMLLGGLWHGVGMTFLAWGALHGIALALHKVWLAVVPNAKVVGCDMKPIWRVCGIVLCFHIVAFGWLLFAADSMTTVEDMLHSIAHSFAIADLRALVESHGAFFVVMALGYLMHLMPRRFDGAVRGAITRGGFVVQLVVMVVAVWLVMQCDMLLTATADGGGALPMYAAF